MARFWPWKRTDDSPASFEKALSTLSSKITTTQAQLEKSRTTSRRLKLLWTLYLAFAYLVYAIVLVLVVGWKKMGALEWTGMAGGPVLIYGIRTGTAAFFNYRIETLTARLKEQQEERSKTIQKLKDATKYDSTLELLEKYGGPENTPKGKKKVDDDGAKSEDNQPDQEQRRKTPNRTTAPPPPTANIPRRDVSQPPPRPETPSDHPSSLAPSPAEATAEFAPNAFGPYGPPPPNPYPPMRLTAAEAHWYDRILDTLLGEDETAAKNRIVLICGRCRQVNGQAPPGTKSLSDIGIWKCVACGASNGEMDEGKRIVREVLGEQAEANESFAINEDGDEDSDLVKVGKEDGLDQAEPVEVKVESPGPTLRPRKGRKKN